MALPGWRDIALNDRCVILAFDGYVTRQPTVQKALHALASYLAIKGAKVEYLHLPDTPAGKVGLDDYLFDHHVESLWRLVKPDAPRRKYADAQRDSSEPAATAAEHSTVQPVPLEEAHMVFRRWLGEDYDTDTLDAMLAAVAVERLDCDPLWLLIVSGSDNAKTETVQALDGIVATIASVITSDAALLSATPKRERAKDATGGLLRKIGTGPGASQSLARSPPRGTPTTASSP